MKREHYVFAQEYIKHHDTLTACAKAYPGTNPANHHSSAAKLLRRADVKTFIKQTEEPAREKALAELQAMAKERIKLEKLDIDIKRHTCAMIVLGKWKVKRSIKLNGELVDVYNDPSQATVLRAIELDTKLELGFFQKDKSRQGIDERLVGIEEVGIMIDGIPDPDWKKELEHQWVRDNPGKVKADIIDQTNIMSFSQLEFLETPPWKTDPEWYYKKRVENLEKNVSVSVQNQEQPIEHQNIIKTTAFIPPASIEHPADTSPPASNNKKTYWEMSPKERWEAYLPLNTNISNYSSEQLSFLENAYCNMSVKAQVNRINSLLESAKYYNRIAHKR